MILGIGLLGLGLPSIRKIKCSANPGGNYSASSPGLPQYDLTFHPLPDGFRYRIASGLSVGRLPPLRVTSLLILRVTVSANKAERSGAPNRNQTYLRLSSNPTRNINPAQNLAVPRGNDPLLQA